MDNTLEEILNKTAELFQRYGIRSVTMDDIARELSISKKTLYNYVKDKKDLVAQVMRNHAGNFNLDKRLDGSTNNAVEDYFEVYSCVRRMVMSSHSNLDYDLRKYYPEIYHELGEKRRRMMGEGIRQNLQKGISEGLYRDDFDLEIIVMWHILRTENMIRSDFMREYNFDKAEVLDEIFSYHLHAVATPKGVEEFKNLLKQKDNE